MPVKPHEGKRRLASNTIFSLIAWFFPIVVGFVTTPILVEGLGAEQYGVLAVILGFLSYSFTFGTGKIVAKFLPEYRAAGEEGKLSQVVSATFLFSLLIGLIGALTVALLTPYIVANILLIPAGSQHTASTAFYFACATGLAMMVGQTFQYVLHGLHRFGSYVMLTTLNGFLLGAGNIVLVLNGFGVAAIMGWSLVAASVIGLLFYLQSRRYLPSPAIGLRVDRSLAREVVKYGGNIILFQIFANALYIFERAWVARKFGTQALTYYSVPMLLAIYMHGVVASFAQAIFPRVNELLNDRERLVTLYQRATKIVLAVVTFLCASYVLAGKMFLTLWVNADFAANSYNLLVIHSITFAFIASLIIALQIAEAFRFSSLTVIMTCTWMLLAIPLMIASADAWKSEGIGLARLAVVIVTVPLIFVVEKMFLGSVLVKFWVAALARICLATVAVALVGYHVFFFFRETWLTLVLGTLVCGTVYGGLLLLTGYFTRDEKAILRELIANGMKFKIVER